MRVEISEDGGMAAHIRDVRKIYQGWTTLSVATVELSDGSRIRREIEHHGNAVCVLPYDPERRVATLVRQLRAPLLQAAGLQDHLEAPAGLLVGDDPQACARREAMEETGLRLGALEHIVCAWTMPGVSTEQMDLFLAPYAETDKIGPGGGLAEEHEDIIVVEMPLDDLVAMIARGTLTDLKTLALVLALQVRHPELFER
jgi:nudix-type nucleoside diphosphatase (YffH/AdpP family)